eukprot:Opistho-2@80956
MVPLVVAGRTVGKPTYLRRWKCTRFTPSKRHGRDADSRGRVLDAGSVLHYARHSYRGMDLSRWHRVQWPPEKVRKSARGLRMPSSLWEATVHRSHTVDCDGDSLVGMQHTSIGTAATPMLETQPHVLCVDT